MAESEKILQSEKVVRDDNYIDSEQAENVKIGAPGILDSENIHNARADNLNVMFENPLANVPRDQLLKEVEDFCQKYNLMDHIDDFRKGALVSQNPAAAMDLTELTDEEKIFSSENTLTGGTSHGNSTGSSVRICSKFTSENFSNIPNSSHVFDGSCCTRYG